mmetsp:Transcript_450/g.1341  ORF Transcript_450/g.1341 Transcript_450/m.1341 type:complete len:428 (-) Transcript_450:106-1389(-)
MSQHAAKANAEGTSKSSEEDKRLRELAQELQIHDQEHRLCTEEVPFRKPLCNADGKDILKKSSTRKGRYLFHIAAQLQPALGGRLGILTNLDSRNPVLYFDFPTGRLKLVGTLLFPKSKYLLLKFGTKDVLCEDVFDTVVLFSDAHWVGSSDLNPTETPLDLPEALQQEIEREHGLVNLGTSDTAATEGPSQSQNQLQLPSQQPVKRSPAKRKRCPAVSDDTEAAPAAADGEDTDCLASRVATSSSAKRRRSIAKWKSSSEEDGDVIEISDDDENVAAVVEGSQRQCLSRSSKTAANKRLSQRENSAEHSGVSASRSSGSGGNSGSEGDGINDDANGAGSPSASEPGPESSPEPPLLSQAKAARRPAGKPVAKRKTAANSSGEEGPPSHRAGKARSRPARAASTPEEPEASESASEPDEDEDDDFSP